MRLKPEELKVAIKSLGLTNEEMANHLGVRVETIYHWLKGKIKIPGRQSWAVRQMLKGMEGENVLASGPGKQ